MRKIIIFFLLLCPILSKAQNIKGYVLSQTDKSPVQFASVALHKLPDSTLVTGSITLTTGQYTIEKVKPGKYHIKVSFIGYATSGKDITISDNGHDVTADTIYLAEASKQLSEVVVMNERLKGTELVDRTVYSIPESAAKASINGYDVLKKIPQIQVDFQNNITLNGKANFIIQVDGKQRDKEFLARLLPTDIKSIEIINNPSGKYEGDIDGVISIILKKEARVGMNGNFGLYAKPFGKPTMATNGSLDYGLGKVTFYVSAFGNIQSLKMNSGYNNLYLMNDSSSISDGAGKFKSAFTSVNTGFDYYINDKNNLSVNLTYRPISQTSDQQSLIRLLKGEADRGTMNSQNTRDMGSNEESGSIYYKKSFSKPIQEFTAETNFYTFQSDEQSNFKNSANGLTFPGSNITRDENNNNKRSYISTKLNYVQPIGMATKLEFGYQIYYQLIDYDFVSSDVSLSNNFKYSEFRNAAYAGLSFNIKKWGFQTNLRVEDSENDINNKSEGYSCFLPSANLQYKISSKHNIKFTYNRRINRPGIYDLNPFQRISYNYSISEGNPDLKPEYRDRLQLTHTWNFGKSNYFSPNVYVEYLSDKISTSNKLVVSPTTGNLVMQTKPYNLLTGLEKGGGFNAMLWFFNINFRYFEGQFNKFDNGEIKLPERKYSSYSVTGNAFYQFKNKITTFLFVNYNGVTVNAQSKSYSMPFYGFGAQRQAGNHSYGFFWLLPFSKDITFSKTITETDYLYSKSTSGFDVSYFIQFMYSYKFNKGKSVKKLNRKVDVESDSKTEGVGR